VLPSGGSGVWKAGDTPWFITTGGAVGGACGVRPLVVTIWPEEPSGIKTPKHATQRTDKARLVAIVIGRLRVGKMARMIFMVSRYVLIAIDPGKRLILSTIHTSFGNWSNWMFPRIPFEYGAFSFELPPDEFSLDTCSVRALTCMKAK
jgi:hypothetical protein